MEFKGTKGKWLVKEHNAFSGEYYLRTKDNDVEVEEDKYNALLISKAPEMLEMLNDLHGRIDFSWEAWGSNEGIELSNKIKQLIKEATEL
jgi:hypothetical protein